MNRREPTRLGWWLINRMNSEGLSQTDFAKKVDLAQATISRWTYEQIRPDTPKLERMADSLKLSEAERVELFASAGHAPVAATVQAGAAAAEDPWPDLLVEARMMLLATSPLTDEDRDELRLMLNAVISQKRPLMRRRRSAS